MHLCCSTGEGGGVLSKTNKLFVFEVPAFR